MNFSPFPATFSRGGGFPENGARRERERRKPHIYTHTAMTCTASVHLRVVCIGLAFGFRSFGNGVNHAASEVSVSYRTGVCSCVSVVARRRRGPAACLGNTQRKTDTERKQLGKWRISDRCVLSSMMQPLLFLPGPERLQNYFHIGHTLPPAPYMYVFVYVRI